MLIPLLALAMVQTAEPIPEIHRGSHLHQACLGSIRAQDNDSGKESAHDAYQSGVCISYINGFIDALDMANVHAICPGNASYGTIARVYVAYMQSHPKEMDEAQSVGLTNALLDGYPCTIPKK
jgi:hypothetical protein